MKLNKHMRIRVLAVCFLLLSGSLVAKSDFDVPAKWASAPAIITNQTSNFNYIPVNKGKEISFLHEENISILINNENGAEEFKFVYVPKLYAVEVTVMSSEGEDSYDEDDAKDLGINERLPYFYKDLFKNFSEFEKINLGTLEKGYEISISYSRDDVMALKDFLGDADCKAFPHQVITYPTVYPKGGHMVTIKMGAEMFINYGAQNDGPSADLESMLEADTTEYVIEAGHYDAIARQYFAYPARMYPTSKFEVVVCPKYKAEDATLVLGTMNELNEEWDESQLKTVVYNNIDAWSSYAKVGKDLDDFMGEFKSKGTDDFLMKTYKAFQSMVYNTGIVEGYKPEMFLGVMIDKLTDMEMDYDVIVGVNRKSGSLDDMILNGELVYGIKVKEKREDYFIFPFTKYTSWNNKDARLLGSEVFLFTNGGKLEDCLFTDDDMPEGLPADNQKVIRNKVKLGDGFTAIITNENTSYSGITKAEYGPMLISVPEYHKATLDKRVFSQYAEFRDEDEADEFKEIRKNIYEAKARSLCDTVEYQRFSLKSTGFEEDEEWLQINEKYTIPGDKAVKFQIKDSMRVYTVSLGKLIDTDYKISNSSYNREGDVYIDYPRIIDYTVRLDIPDGYAIFGFEGFDAEFNTDFASFKSKSMPEGKELKISTNLVLKKTHLSEGEWQQLATMLNKFEELAKVQITMAGN